VFAPSLHQARWHHKPGCIPQELQAKDMPKLLSLFKFYTNNFIVVSLLTVSSFAIKNKDLWHPGYQAPGKRSNSRATLPK